MKVIVDSAPKDELRALAVQRLKKKRDFRAHLVVFTLVNTFVVGLWWATGAGSFWPIFLIAFWGIGLVMNALDVYRPEGPNEDQIRHEMDRLRRHDP